MIGEYIPSAPVRFYKDYDRYFDPNVYLRTHVNAVRSQEEAYLRPFVMDKLHDFCQRVDVTGTTLLDVGCGPTITGVISAVNRFQDVYLSDISRPNRESLVKWLHKDPGHHDWSPFLKYILEKEGLNTSWKSREDVLRTRIRGILYCDVTNTNCLAPRHLPPFDAIVSVLCLNAAANDVTEYRHNLKNVSQLVKPGGWAMIVDNLQEGRYNVGGEVFFCMRLGLKEFKAAWEDAGFRIVEFHRLEENDEERTINVALLAQKI